MSRDPESCPGVIRPVASKVASGQLKFGMERILSGEISTTQHEHTELPCSECVSSLLRCCQLSSPANNVANNGVESNETYYSGYYTTLHNPRPVRPYTNPVLLPEGHSSVLQGPANKRKRSWSRAVFSNLQRKGLEKRFQLQKYITKPDRRQLAATLGLTDAQVKVWFQNRRMKWRHTKEGKSQGGERPDSTQEPHISVDS